MSLFVLYISNTVRRNFASWVHTVIKKFSLETCSWDLIQKVNFAYVLRYIYVYIEKSVPKKILVKREKRKHDFTSYTKISESFPYTSMATEELFYDIPKSPCHRCKHQWQAQSFFIIYTENCDLTIERRGRLINRNRWPRSWTPDLELFKKEVRKSRSEKGAPDRFEPGTPWSPAEHSHH